MRLDRQYLSLHRELQRPPPRTVLSIDAVGLAPTAPVSGLQGHLLFRHLKQPVERDTNGYFDD
jgi:hypothetical protein